MKIRFVNAIVPFALLGAVPVANAQEKGTFIIDVIGGPVSPSNPSVTVKIFASFPSKYWAFGDTHYDLLSSDPNGAFSDITKPTGSGALAPGSCSQPWFPGMPDGNGGLEDLHAFQFNAVGCVAHTYNPIQIWEATWTAGNFAPREIILSTDKISQFSVYTNSQESFPDLQIGYEPGSVSFQVVPVPGMLSVLGFVMFAIQRRR